VHGQKVAPIGRFAERFATVCVQMMPSIFDAIENHPPNF